METKVTFQSDGLTLSGVVHVPDDLKPGEKRAAFIILHGFGGYKDGPEHVAQANIICKWGYVAFRIDLRGCGESEGERGRLIIDEEVRDAISAFEFLESHEAVDPKRIGIYGDSLGATVAFKAGSDKRVAAVIGSGGFGDGARTFRFMHSTPEAFRAFLDRLEEAKRLFRETGEKIKIARFDIVPIPEALRPQLGPGAIMEFPFETAVNMYESQTEDFVSEIAPRPLLLIHPAADQVVPASESYEVFKRSGKPTELYITAGEDHFPLSGKNPQSPLIIKMWLDRFFPLHVD